MQYFPPGRHLQIYPEELAFPLELGKDSILTVSLYNPAGQPVAFKIKTTSTDRYRVRPNFAVVPPLETKHVKVVLVAQKELTQDLTHCKDRFLIQSLPLEKGADVTQEDFKTHRHRLQDSKLKVSVNLISSPGGDRRLAGGRLPTATSSPLESEIRQSLLRIAGEQGTDGHKSALCKFSELLLLNGIISTQQMGSALDLVEDIFDTPGPAVQRDSKLKVGDWLDKSEPSNADPEEGVYPPEADLAEPTPGSPPARQQPASPVALAAALPAVVAVASVPVKPASPFNVKDIFPPLPESPSAKGTGAAAATFPVAGTSPAISTAELPVAREDTKSTSFKGWVTPGRSSKPDTTIAEAEAAAVVPANVPAPVAAPTAAAREPDIVAVAKESIPPPPTLKATTTGDVLNVAPAVVMDDADQAAADAAIEAAFADDTPPTAAPPAVDPFGASAQFDGMAPTSGMKASRPAADSDEEDFQEARDTFEANSDPPMFENVLDLPESNHSSKASPVVAKYFPEMSTI